MVLRIKASICVPSASLEMLSPKKRNDETAEQHVVNSGGARGSVDQESKSYPSVRKHFQRDKG